MKLEILTPDSIVFSGEISTISLPGKHSSFSVRKNHAPIIASLESGKISFISNLNHYEFETGPGVIEACNNIITICIESANKK